MMRQVLLAGALVVATVTGAFAHEIRGMVLRIEEPVGVVVLDDGRMFQVTEATTILVREEPVALGVLRNGDVVVLRSATPLTSGEPASAMSGKDDEIQASALPRVLLLIREPLIDESIEAP